jgi:hypothetical protein
VLGAPQIQPVGLAQPLAELVLPAQEFRADVVEKTSTNIDVFHVRMHIVVTQKSQGYADGPVRTQCQSRGVHP